MLRCSDRVVLSFELLADTVTHALLSVPEDVTAPRDTGTVASVQ